MISGNKYRGLCRRLVNECTHPELTHARKLVLLKLADLIDDREGFTAYPAFTTMAQYAGVSRDTAIRAVNVSKKIGLLIRVKGSGKKGLGGTSNRYGFRLKEVAGVPLLSETAEKKEVAGEPPKRSQASHERGSRPATQQERDKQTYKKKEETKDLEEKTRWVGERAPAGPKSEPFPWIDIAFGSATRIYTVPLMPRICSAPKFDMAAFRAEMAARGLDLSESRRRRPYQ
jgi:hypothetical protein